MTGVYGRASRTYSPHMEHTTVPSPPVEGDPWGSLAGLREMATAHLRFAWDLRHYPDATVRAVSRDSIRENLKVLRRLR